MKTLSDFLEKFIKKFDEIVLKLKESFMKF